MSPASASKIMAGDWREIRRNELVGVLSLTLSNGLKIHEVSLHEKAGRRWVVLPARQYASRKWIPVVTVPDHTFESFQREALAAVDIMFERLADDARRLRESDRCPGVQVSKPATERLLPNLDGQEGSSEYPTAHQALRGTTLDTIQPSGSGFAAIGDEPFNISDDELGREWGQR